MVRGLREMGVQTKMTWNPTVRTSPIVVTARPTPRDESTQTKEMESAAAAAVSMELARQERMRRVAGNIGNMGHASSWVIQGRMDAATSWNG
jgi:hypothetical protein